LRSAGEFGAPQQISTVSRPAFVTAATSLTGGEPNFARCLAVFWAATLCVHFRGLCPLTEFCQVQNSLCVQVLRSPIMAALLHSNPAECVSKTWRRGTGNGITEISQRVSPIYDLAAITLGIGPHSSSICCGTSCTRISTTNLPPFESCIELTRNKSTKNRSNTVWISTCCGLILKQVGKETV